MKKDFNKEFPSLNGKGELITLGTEEWFKQKDIKENCKDNQIIRDVIHKEIINTKLTMDERISLEGRIKKELGL